MIKNSAELLKGQDTERSLRGHCLELLESMFDAIDVQQALRRALRLEGSQLRVGRHKLDLADYEHLYVIGFGKAAGAMALEAEEILGAYITEGAVNAPEPAPTRAIQVTVAAHPLPDENGAKGAQKMLEIAQKAGEKDLVVCLISGGGSALLPLPAPGISLTDKQRLTSQLLKAGASIGELNCVRKHLSQVKGGQLVQAAAPARVLSLIASDVIGNPLDVIASGPTAPDPSTFPQAVRVLKKHGLWEGCPASIQKRLAEGADRRLPETPKPGNPCFQRVINHIFLDNATALHALKKKAVELGYHHAVHSDRLAGEARTAGEKLARALHSLAHQRGHRPLAVFAAGETTVTVKGKGRGGRNLELVLGGCAKLAEIEGALLCSVGTDGVDGSSDAAGAMAATSTLARAKELGLDWKKSLAENDSHAFFERLGDLIRTGYTKTNVMDVQVLLLG